jgi:ABC-type glycerol-3-phosphate transport system permease component
MAQIAQTSGVTWREDRRIRRAITNTILYAILIVVGAIILLPLSWMLTAALRGEGEAVFTVPTSWFPTESFHFENFVRVLTYESYPLWRPTLNTLFLVTLNVIGTVLSNSLIAYAFARLRFPGRDLLFRIIVFTMLLPGAALLIPSFLLFNELGWYGTYYPLWVPAFFGNAWSIFITRQYMRSFPRDLDDAARIDGCGYFGIYRYIILPMSKPVLTVLTVFTIVGVWNDFTGPLLYLSNSDQFTLAIALDYFRRSAFSTMSVNTTNLVMAASLLSVLPILVLYFLLQEYLIGGIASVGLKG